MSILPKAFFGFLILVMLASFTGSWMRLNKIHQEEWWPVREQFGYNDYHNRSAFMTVTVKTIHFFDTIPGKIISLLVIAGLSYICGKLAFQHDWLYTGLLTLQAFATYCAWIWFDLRFFDPLMPLVRM
jgi:hypothetical protein